jgi:spermidine/putrescine transport system ATP-binding protein
MNQGHILQIGSPEEIYEHPSNRFVANFIGETNFLNGEVMAIRSDHIRLLVDGCFIVNAPSTHGVSPRQEVSLAIRPEKLEVTINEIPATSIPGTIKEVIYIGTDLRYEVEVSDNTTLVVREQNRGGSATQRFQRGNQVHVCWEMGTTNLLID